MLHDIKKHRDAYKKRKARSLAKLRRVEVPEDMKARVAETVHQCVCEYTDSDGFGKCHLYALGAAMLARLVTGREFIPQAGELMIHPDPDRPEGVGFCPDEEGMAGHAFHCWAATKEGELVDLATRHLKTHFQHTQEWELHEDCHPLEWKRPEPPSYIWTRNCQIAPTWISWKADPQTCEDYFRMICEEADSPFLPYLLRRWKGLPPMHFFHAA